MRFARALILTPFRTLIRLWPVTLAPAPAPTLRPHTHQARLRLLWLEQFQRDPFLCMALLEGFLGLPPFDYRRYLGGGGAGAD